MSVGNLVAGYRTLAEVEAKAREYVLASHAPATRRAYASALSSYSLWCNAHGFEPYESNHRQVAMYLADRATTLTVSSLRVHLAAIAVAHRALTRAFDPKHANIAQVLEGVARKNGTRPTRQAKPAVFEDLSKMVAVCGTNTLGLRNRAMLLVAFGAALRRSEAVNLDVGDVEFHENGIILLIDRSKTDQHARGVSIAIHDSDDDALSVTKAIKDWLVVYQPKSLTSPLFCGLNKAHRMTGERMNSKVLERLIKETAIKAELPMPHLYSGHSLRSGLLTSASEHQALLPDIMRQSRHKSPDVALSYMRTTKLWENNVTSKVFGRKS